MYDFGASFDLLLESLPCGVLDWAACECEGFGSTGSLVLGDGEGDGCADGEDDDGRGEGVGETVGSGSGSVCLSSNFALTTKLVAACPTAGAVQPVTGVVVSSVFNVTQVICSSNQSMATKP